MRPCMVVSKSTTKDATSCYLYYDVDFRNGTAFRFYVTLNGQLFLAAKCSYGNVTEWLNLYDMGEDSFKSELERITSGMRFLKMKHLTSTKSGGELNGSVCIGDRNPGNTGGNSGTEPPAPDPGPGIGSITINPPNPDDISTQHIDGIKVIGTKKQREKIKSMFNNMRLSNLANTLLNALADSDASINCVEYKKKHSRG